MASITTSRIECGFALSSLTARPRRMMVVRAETVNPDIKKDKAELVHSIDVTDLSKPQTAYCRCWRAKTFPRCDGSHVKHNEETGDNVDSCS
ncbi:CDGSH iron-sulfur domain-containing protein NEET-like [Lycium ferocissimum]|uniref:CDGSH iron-sulfur domain-containing protein NEET-like n=1 Tax=Lycium ferocissimum TaxID=112874 RepID=UPI0028158F8B|nr:CDGSH iron-sulfur domain-containing protein NEET-like [Lycium ferocissimum]